MSRDTAFLLIGLIGGGLISWVITKAYANRRNVVVPYTRLTPLSPSKEVPGFTQQFNEKPIVEPYLLELSLFNRGPSDISPDHFNGGECRFEFKESSPVAFIRSNPENAAGIESNHVSNDLFRVGVKPCQIRQGDAFTASFIVSGKPTRAGKSIKILDAREGRGRAGGRDYLPRVMEFIPVLGGPAAYYIFGGGPFALSVWVRVLLGTTIVFFSVFVYFALARLDKTRRAEASLGKPWD